MVTWEYQVVRMDTLKLFQMHLESLGRDGWEMVNAQYAIHAEEELERTPGAPDWIGPDMVPPRPVWLAFFKRKVEDPFDQLMEEAGASKNA